MNQTARRWCFTGYEVQSTGWTLAGYDWETVPREVRGCVFQTEKCPTTGALHIQGYAEFYAPVRFAVLKRITGDNALNCRICDGDRNSNIVYVTKADTRVDGPSGTFGDWPESAQGKRSDLDGVHSLIRDDGVTWATKRERLWDNHFRESVKFARGISAAFEHYRSRSAARVAPNVIVLWGAPGTGKTRYVYDRVPTSELYRVPPSSDGRTVWFDNYVGQQSVLFDDFDGQCPRIGVMLQVLDRYPLTLGIKCGHTFFNPETIYITTNLKPETEWYTEAHPYHREGILRRLTEIRHLEGPIDPHIRLAPEDDYFE